MDKTEEEILYNDFNYVCEQLYRILVQDKDMQMSYKELFAFLEQLSIVLKQRADSSKVNIGIEKTLLSTGLTVGELYRDLNKSSIMEKLIKLDHLEDLRREKNRKRKSRNH